MRRHSTRLGVLAGIALARTVAAAADAPPAEGWQRYVTPLLSDRVRVELVDYFRPPGTVAHTGADRYAFFANQLRAGFKVNLPHLTLLVEGQDVRLVNLPTDASFGPPYGNLGVGALYYFHSPGLDRESTQGETFLRQGYLTLSDPGITGLSITGGRFEHSDGLEVVPKDPTLAWIKRQRIGERLVGPFNFTHIGRSYDGFRIVYDHPAFNLTAIATRPTHGGFEISAMRQLGDVGLLGAALTLKGIPRLTPNADIRLFYFGYDDRRFDDDREEPARPVKVDNRPGPERVADDGSLRIHTIGAHATTVADAGPGKIDAMLWGVVQSGTWGRLSHHAWAWAAEAGYQLPSVWGAPWLRFGINQSSGDDDPTDRDHETFFQMLPTVRIYALFPFFNQMNNQDIFGQLVLRPHPKVTIRSDFHYLRLTERNDLWYAGAGATNDDVFGFSGIPANRHRELAQLVDLTVIVNVLPQVTVQAYYGHAFGQGVVRKTFQGKQANYGFLEVAYKY